MGTAIFLLVTVYIFGFFWGRKERDFAVFWRYSSGTIWQTDGACYFSLKEAELQAASLRRLNEGKVYEVVYYGENPNID